MRLVLFSIVAITSQCLHAQPLQQGIGQKGGRNAPASLHFSCVGAGRPIVILEAGGGWGAADWAKVQPGIGNLTQVCSYDRDPDRCCDEVIDDLRSLYARRPFPVHNVLVGHSLGGLYVRRLAARFPDAAGLVLVDSADEKQLTGMIVPGLKPELYRPGAMSDSEIAIFGQPEFTRPTVNKNWERNRALSSPRSKYSAEKLARL